MNTNIQGNFQICISVPLSLQKHTLPLDLIIPCKHLPFQSQQQEHLKKVRNMFKVNNKDTKTPGAAREIFNQSFLINLDVINS